MLVVLTTLALMSSARLDEPPAKEVLSAITERGRSLAGYDDACWHASDAVMVKKPKPGSVARYIARKTDGGWVVAFGKLDDEKDRFLVAYEATQGKEPGVFTVKEINPPREDDGFLRSAARSIDTALKDFRGERRPYNVALLTAEKDQFWVYVVPAPTKAGVWPLGGDVRYRVSQDGAKIVEKRQMHKSIIEKAAPAADDGNKLVAGMHSHVLSDMPEDTDVFHVLSRKPAIPEMIVTGRFRYTVNVDGGIEYVGKSEDLRKEK